MGCCNKSLTRKSLLYKTGVEYGDYTINHVQGCSHGCKYPCYASMLAKRFGTVKTYLCFTTDPFMYGYEDICNLSIDVIKLINSYNLPCTALTKGVLPIELADLSKDNSYGITLISLNEEFRKKMEPGSAPYLDRINSLKKLHDKGCKTWVSIEPYPTPNIIDQDFEEILNSISFVDKIIFGRLHYNKLVSQYKGYKKYYNNLASQVIKFCDERNIEYHIKEKTITEMQKVYQIIA